MALKGVLVAALCVASLAAAGSSRADEYRPEEFFSLDLPKAVFSPKRLGPPAQFEPVRVQAKTDFQSKPVHTTAVHVEAMPKAAAKLRTVHARAEKPRTPARTKLVRSHRNPLDANASDTRIQVWPCRSGGICNWQRAAQ
ncbi:MAG: hypothetical protein QOH32_4191 [Bradyrhizobium sp.]|jgi:hypothetical protein|nr:hypothetical protein [Bradyrhizobium sp.]